MQKFFPGVAFFLTVCNPPAMAAPNYIASQIALEDIRAIRTVDVNGDRRPDVIVSTWSEARGRELLIYWQDGAGRFPGTPSRRIEIKTDIVAVGFADVRAEPGSELLFVTRSAVYSFSSAKESYSGNLNKLFDWHFVNTVPEERSLGFLPELTDLNGDGLPDLLLPGKDRYAWFAGQEGEAFTHAGNLPAPYFRPGESENRGDVNFSVKEGLQFTVTSPSDFAGLVEERLAPRQKAENESGREFILDVERWLAPPYVANINDDSRPDLVYVDDANEDKQFLHRFNALLQNETGYPEQVDWQARVRVRSELFVRDLNGDGLDDVVVTDGGRADTATVYFYINRGGEFDFESPDQVMRFSGYDTNLEFRDLNDDSMPELLVTSYSLSAVDAVRDGKLARNLLIYAGGGKASSEGELFARRPNYKLEEKFSADNFKGLAQRHSFEADVDGDGKADVVALDDRGALAAKTIRDGFAIVGDPFWRFVPDDFIQSFIVVDFNGDASSDFLLRHRRSLTVLVSQP